MVEVRAMSTDMKLILENVRCFRGRHEIPVRPLTLLVGENSSGKTTMLAMLAAVSDPEFPGGVDFNRNPYGLGGYHGIASRSEDGKDAPSSFAIGFGLWEPFKHYHESRCVFESREGAPALREFNDAFDDVHVEILLPPHGVTSINVRREGSTFQSIKATSPAGASSNFSIFLAKRAVYQQVSNEDENLRHVAWAMDRMDNGPFPLRSLAPVRTRPLRTYDRVRLDFEPEGDHVPSLLKAVLTQRGNGDRSVLATALEAYGRESGLFDQLKIRRLGNLVGDPFQIQISTGGLDVNLADVGYGVSQALPIIVESVLAAEEHLLIQQPEVHLHPRAQAALGSFFASIVAGHAKHFVVETHSDHLVDRVRQEVARGKIAATDVLIVFFDRQGGETKVFPLELDTEGNVLDAPASYRRFFLEEELALFTRAGGDPVPTEQEPPKERKIKRKPVAVRKPARRSA
jgi:energy-coupling factor transporter ATP-binding protein EcfA2